jgi:hypothetical protein
MTKVGSLGIAVAELSDKLRINILPNNNYFSCTKLSQTMITSIFFDLLLHIFLHKSSKMPSVSNPNVPKRKASRRKIQKRNAVKKICKNARGTATSSVIFPTSGPLAPLSSKKARKVEKARAHARQRAIEKGMEKEGEVNMTGLQSPVLSRR